MRREPLLLPTMAFAAGILVFHLLPQSVPSIAAVLALCSLVLVATLTLPVIRRWTLTALCLFLTATGAFLAWWHRPGATPQLTADDTETVILDGCVVNPPVFSAQREQFTLELSAKAFARISVGLKENEQVPLRYGDPVEVVAKVRRPRNYENPAGFDYAAYLARQHIYWTGSVRNLADVKHLPGRCGSRPLAALYDVRTWALGRLVSLYPDDRRTASLLQAILLGESGGVERRWTSDYRLTGTYHALVISGQHVSVLAFTLLLLLRLLRLRRIPALGVATVACWLYAFVSGLSAPVVRAAGGFTLFLIASYFFRRLRILNLLAVVALIYLVFDPGQLFEASFQLSFLSAAAIAVFALPLMERFTGPLRNSVKRFDQIAYDPMIEPAQAAQWRVELRSLAETVRVWTGLPRSSVYSIVTGGVAVVAFVAEAVAVSACVQFGLALPMVLYFHRLSITGLSANVIVVPLLSAVVPLGFAAIATGSHWLAVLTKILLDFSEVIAQWHVRFEPVWRVAALPLWLSVTFAAALVCLSVAIRTRHRWLYPALVTALVLFGCIYLQPWRPLLSAGTLELDAIDVSQGDSLLLIFPNRETMLIDAGGFPGMSRMARKPQIDVGEDVVSPYLWSRRIRHLDYTVLTHGHSDHMDGLAAVLDNFRPHELWIGAEPATDAWGNVQKHAAEAGTKIVPLTRSAPLRQVGGATIRVLAPAPDYLPEKEAKNDDSLVLEITFGQRSILLTGDAERPVESQLVSLGTLHPITLLKVGHHGSRTSSSAEFLHQLHPQFAFISDGYKNQFHHPNPDVLQRLHEEGTQVWRTDEHGLLVFKTDGNNVQVSSFQ